MSKIFVFFEHLHHVINLDLYRLDIIIDLIPSSSFLVDNSFESGWANIPKHYGVSEINEMLINK